MTTPNIEKALTFVLQWEGGYSNDEDDPGGETKWGISKRAHPDLDIKNLKIEDALKVYREEYWDALDCDNLSWPVAMAVFDTAVNCGNARARRWLKEVIPLDGEKEEDDITRDFLNLRIQHYLTIIKRNPALSKYKRGWMNRVTDLKKYIVTAVETG